MKFKNPFKRDPAKKEKTAVYKEVRSEISTEIGEIEKIADPAERVRRYEAASEKLDGFYDGDKINTVDRITAAAGGTAGTAVGFLTGILASAVTVVAAPYVAGPVLVGVLGANMVAGAAGGASMGFNKAQRKKLRTKYGTLRNAGAMHKLQETLDSKTEKDRELIRSQNSRGKFNDTFRSVEAVPVKAPVIKLVNKPKAP